MILCILPLNEMKVVRKNVISFVYASFDNYCPDEFVLSLTDCKVRYSRNTQQMVQMEDSKHWDALAITVLVVTVLSITFTYGCVTHSSVFHIVIIA